MNLQTFFEKFELFADVPDAVGKMRELVLELAVQGKLVEQRTDDGESTQLLVEIDRERDARSTMLRTPSDPATATDCERPFATPSNWTWTQLGKIALQIQYGYTASADVSARDIRMLRITDIQNSRVNWPSVPGCHIEDDEAEKYLLSTNDILIARTGGTIGKSFIVPDAPVKSVFASYLIRVTPPRSISARYLKVFLDSPLYWMQLREMSAGTGQPNVNGQALGRLAIPLPPLAEQKRIVAKVDELMALCDRLEAQQQERQTRHTALTRASLARFADAPTTTNLNFLFHNSYSTPPAELRKSILTLAVQGLLVTHDEESCGWKTQKLKDLTTKIGSGSTPSGGKESYQDSGVPLIRSMNVHFGGFVHHGLAFLSREQAEKLKNVIVKENDVLLNITGASIGRVATAPKDMEGARVNQHVCILRLGDEVLPKFLELFLASPVVQDLIDDVQVGATREALTKAMIEQFEIPVPSLAEQRRIVTRVDQLMALVDQLEEKLKNSRMLGERLLEAAIHELVQTNSASNQSTSMIDRAAIGCYALKRMQSNPSFARTAEVKVLYLVEAHLGLPLGGEYHREAAGPFDKWIYEFERQADKEGWFKTSNEGLTDGRSITRYKLLPAIQSKVDQAIVAIGERREEFDRLLACFKTLTTEEIEIIATLFAAWNDALIDGNKPNDDWIIREVRENWHERKQRFSPERLSSSLSWMRNHKLTPTGKSPRTIHQVKLQLR